MSHEAAANALCEAGLVAFNEGAFAQAAAYFADALARDPARVSAWLQLGNALLSAGDAEAAAGAYARGLAIDPENAWLYCYLGAALRRAGDPARAAAAYAEAIMLGLETAEALNNLGLALADDARFTDAEAAYLRALALDPKNPSILVNLGNALGEAADLARAIPCYEAALLLDAHHVQANYNLFAALYDDRDPGPAEQCLAAVLAGAPEHAGALFHLGALAGLRHGRDAATPFFSRLPAELHHWITSFEYVLTHRDQGTRLFTDGFRLLDHALACAPSAGLVLELGVRRGSSIRFLAAKSGGIVHGFDSFEGLPEAWRGVPRGAYSTQGELPEVPENVLLHPGWFSDTLPVFAQNHAGPIRFLNIDCDLYRSTCEALAALGPRLTRGSVLVFDEYLSNPGWEEDEHKALLEASKAQGFAYRYLAFSLFSKQAAIVIQ